MYHPPLYQGEIGAPVKAVEHFDNREPVDRRLGVRPELDGARPAPALMYADIGQPTRGELADRGRAIDVIDGLEIDVLGKIKMARKAAEGVPMLLVGHRAGEDVDPVPGHDSDDESPRCSILGSPSFLGWP